MKVYMNLLQLVLTIALVSATAPQFEEVQVQQATEAETITVLLGNTPQTVRYIGVASPQPWDPIQGRQQWAEAAGGLARDELVARTAYLEYDAQRYDSRGQLWAYVWTEQPLTIDNDTIRTTMFNAQLILEGYAIAISEHPNTRYSRLFAQYQKEAQAANRGIWSQTGRAEVLPED